MTTPYALIFDVDGTLADTERDGHRVAFNRAFEACGVPWRWDEAHYGDLLRITGGRERLLFSARAAIERYLALQNAVGGEIPRTAAA